MTDTRESERKFPICYLKVFDRESNKMVGRVVDISTEGMRLVGDSPLEFNREYRLRMPMPEAVRPEKQVAFDADVRWTGPDLNPDFSDTGLKLSNVSEEDHRVINHLLRSYVFHG